MVSKPHPSYDAVPVELRERDQWVVWKAERRRDGKWTKVPYRAVNHRAKASSTDPGTWGTFEQATAVRSADAQGIGYVFSPDEPYTGVDFDACIDANGELHTVVADALRQLGGYQERSPSGTGMHAIVKGKLTGDRHKTTKTPWGGAFEIYDQGRFFTFTGNGDGTPAECQGEIDALVVQMFGEPSRNGDRPTSDRDDPESNRPVEELIEESPRLGEIARHEGKAPKDESASGWDYYLACESVRSGLSRGEFAALLRHSRPDDRKATRADYVKRTWEKANQRVAADEADPAKRISRRWNLGNDPIESGELVGDVASGDAIVLLRRRSDLVLRLPRLRDLYDPRAHTRVVSGVAKTRFSPLNNEQAVDIAQLIIELCGGEDADPLEESRQWASDFLDAVDRIIDVRLDSEWEPTWGDLVEREDQQRKSWSWTVAMRDTNERLWLPAKPFKEHIRAELTWALLTARMREIGWKRVEIDRWQTGISRKLARRIHTVFYVGKP